MNVTGSIKRLLWALAFAFTAELLGTSSAVAAPYWVYFKQKAAQSADVPRLLQEARGALTEANLLRRTLARVTPVVSERDLLVPREYISQVISIPAVRLRHTSRWLNAISIECPPATLTQIASLPFVKNTELVAVGHGSVEPAEQDAQPANQPRRDHDLDYGRSLRQNNFLNTPELHDRGYLGQGVIVGICDTGFDNLRHNCFRELDVLAAWDFLNNNAGVGDEEDMGSGEHGTRVLSIVGGYDPGNLIGTAPRARFVLAKTENTEWERRVEEDNWIAAVEWMDSLGVNIVSSSLGYIDWYQYADLDGRTAAITVAANHAAEIGMIIVNAMGNSGRNNYPREKCNAPADGPGVLSIGATNSDSSLAIFSSHGPTYDGRIKPDLCSYGSSVSFASSVNNAGYGAGAGTSFSTPAITGLCALLLQVEPELDPAAMLDLLKSAANHRDAPDTLFGWGIPDGLAAYRALNNRQVSLKIPLRRGWNIASMNMRNPPAGTIIDIFRELRERGRLEMVKDGSGHFYLPQIGFNNIPFWNNFEGYQVKLSDADTLSFAGVKILPTTAINLHQGWQYVAYLPDYQLEAPGAFASLVNQNILNIAKDERGHFFLPHRGFNNMDILTEGKGYQLSLSADGALRYPRANGRQAALLKQTIPVHYPPPDPTGVNCSVLMIGNGIGDGSELAINDLAGKVVGVGAFEGGLCGLAVWGDEEDCPLGEMEVWDPASGEVVHLDLHLLEGEWRYSPDAIIVAEITSPAPTLPKMLSVELSPVPTNGRIRLSVQGGNELVAVEIQDLQGRVIDAKSLKTASGNGIISFDMGARPSGVYLAVVRSRGEVVTNRVVLLK